MGHVGSRDISKVSPSERTVVAAVAHGKLRRAGCTTTWENVHDYLGNIRYLGNSVGKMPG